IALRAELDALPVTERTGLAYASTKEGVMHACGHDGHTAMLLGAARLLSQAPDFDGTVHFVFQPAEENEGGSMRMIEAGLFERFPVEAV
ncbi:M20/M25/M40 family metallo-hydrolase, partial [Acinetobacter baumannii]|uniref:M20/M25/M40 family metallo-hydrolase n=1 Tax=Acinetobacter baumannii TaxID=470 RepID=UPI0013D16702